MLALVLLEGVAFEMVEGVNFEVLAGEAAAFDEFLELGL